MDAGCISLVIDGTDCAGEFEQVDFATPRLVYREVSATGAPLGFLGPLGFQVTVINPSARLRALVDGGVATHDLTITMAGMAITHVVQFHKEWEVDGVTRIFGCLARDRDSEALWVPVTSGALVEQ